MSTDHPNDEELEELRQAREGDERRKREKAHRATAALVQRQIHRAEIEEMLARLSSVEEERDTIWNQKNDLQQEINRLRKSITWRIGHFVTLPANTVRKASRRLTRRKKSGLPNPETIRLTPLAQYALSVQSAIEGSSGRKYISAMRITSKDPSDKLQNDLLARRKHSPRLVSVEEVSRIQDLTGGEEAEFWSRALTDVRSIRYRRHPGPLTVASREKSAIVIDARVLQETTHFGVKTVAERLFINLTTHFGDDVDVFIIQTPSLPTARSVVCNSSMFHEWHGLHTESVVAFFQLAPLRYDRDPQELDLLSRADIRTFAFWFDFIPAHAPSEFMPTIESLLEYQTGLEKLPLYDVVLTLSNSVSSEITAFFDEGLDSAAPHPKVLTAGCFSALENHAQAAKVVADTQVETSYILVFGNHLPHKNIGVGIAGAAMFNARAERQHRVILLASMTPEQLEFLPGLAAAYGQEQSLLEFNPQVSNEELAELLRDAAVAVIPSLDEGFSIPVLDALTFDCPVVTSRIPAHMELLGDGVWMFDPSSPESLASALDSVLSETTVSATQRAHVAPETRSTQFDAAVIQAIHENLPSLARVQPSKAPTSLDTALPLSKICELEDFENRDFAETMRRIFRHELARFGPTFPEGKEWRKYWEVTMAIRTFEREGLLDGTRDFLGVGAGNEPTVFYLTRHAHQVIATDLYDEDGWEESADSSMLVEPGTHWPFAWNPERLEVLSMNALDLNFPNDTFDVVFSSSSVEHFGDWAAVKQAMTEIYRVLKPGGVASISSEYRIAGDGSGLPGVLMFGDAEIRDILIGDLSWDLIDDFDATVSPRTLATTQYFAHALADHGLKVTELGGLWTHHMEYDRYPHIVLRDDSYIWTSFHIALRKR